MRAHALLGGAEQMIGEQPFMQGNLAALEHRSNRDAVLLAAIVALDHAVADRAFGVSFGRTTTLGWEPLRTERATMRADRTIGPTQSFKMLAGLILVGEMGSGEVRHALSLWNGRCFVKYIIAYM